MSLQNPNLDPIVNGASLYVNGLQLTWLTGTTIQVSAGACRDLSNSFDMVLSAPVIINTTVNGVNGLDTGVLLANSSYAVMIITDASNYYPPACLITLNAAAPVMPTGYNLARRIGYLASSGVPSIYKFIQADLGGNLNLRAIQYDVPIAVLASGHAITFTTISLLPGIPYVGAPAYISSSFTPAVATDLWSLRPTGSTALAGGSPVRSSGAVAAVPMLLPPHRLIIGSNAGVPSLDYILTAVGDSLSLNVIGYDDYL